MTDAPILRAGLLAAFKRWKDGKTVYVDPEQVAAIEPADLVDEPSPVSAIRLYALGGTILVKGEVRDVAMVIQRQRMATVELGIETVVEFIREELDREPESELN